MSHQQQTAIAISEETRRKANLRVLQRLDPTAILDVLGSATHVVLYEFNDEVQAWEKCNVEGSLFVVSRRHGSTTCFKLVILNRNSKHNWESHVSHSFQMQVREPYLIFKGEQEKEGLLEKADEDSSSRIKGIWFHDGKEREVISKLLDQIITNSLGDDINGTNTTADNNDVNYGDAAATLLSPLSLSEKIGEDTTLSRSQGNASVPPKLESKQSQIHPNLVLDKKSLQLSLMSLLQDERFLDLIHAQYVKVAHARACKYGGNNKPADCSSEMLNP